MNGINGYYIEEKPGLYRINLAQKLKGFQEFISCWLYKVEDLTFIVDPGPLATVDILVDQLRELGVSNLDLVLLTHIHIDHAGGTGRLLEIFPDATVICHPKGIPHMIDPEKLWKGSLKVLGYLAEAYGEIVPIAEDKISFQESIKIRGKTIQVIDTPGHAPHHLCYILDGLLFAGEVAGVSFNYDGKLYRRPATPPRFKLEISLSSIDRVLEAKPEMICYGHCGCWEGAENALRMARQQLILWVDVVRKEIMEGNEEIVKSATDALLINDPVFGAYNYLDQDIQHREDYFIKNSIDGMKEYIMADRSL